MMDEQNYYFEKEGYMFIFKDIFEKVNDEHLELRRKLFNGEISKNEFRSEYKKGSDIIEKATKLVKTKKEFVNEYLKFRISEKRAIEQWKHEREHCKIIQQNGCVPEIVLFYVIDRQAIQNKNPPFMLIPATKGNELHMLEEWSIEQFRDYSLKTLEIKSLSVMDKKQKDSMNLQPQRNKEVA